jgi:hypothetical protein
MRPATPASAVDHLRPSSAVYGQIMDGPHAGTFAPVGLSLIRRIGGIDHKRFEEPAGSGRYVWRLRPTTPIFENPLTEWDNLPPFSTT